MAFLRPKNDRGSNRRSTASIQVSIINFEIDLPDNPVRYTAVPDAIPKDGIWGEAGINVYNVAMSETETKYDQ